MDKSMSLYYVVRDSWTNSGCLDYVYGPDNWQKCNDIANQKNAESLISPYMVAAQRIMVEVIS